TLCRSACAGNPPFGNVGNALFRGHPSAVSSVLPTTNDGRHVRRHAPVSPSLQRCCARVRGFPAAPPRPTRHAAEPAECRISSSQSVGSLSSSNVSGWGLAVLAASQKTTRPKAQQKEGKQNDKD